MTETTETDGAPQEHPTEDVQPADAPADETTTTEEVEDEGAEPETFPAKVVRDLRKENARYRERAGKADELAQRLHVALVAQTGRLADPTDLEFDEAHIEDPEKLAAAVDDLLARKPHLKARRIAGDVGQGNRGNTAGEVDLLGSLRGLVG